MEAIITSLIAEVRALSEMPQSEGGIQDILPLEAVYFGDPGLIPVSLYPAATVEPDEDTDVTETTGYDTLELTVLLSVHIDARAYFDVSPDEALGDRKLVQAVNQMRRWFQTRAKRTLDGTVLDLQVARAEYRRIYRGEVPVKTARLSLVIRKNYPRN